MGWTSVAVKIEIACATALARIARACARKPALVITICTIFSLACGAGVFTIKVESQGDRLWVDQHSVANGHLATVAADYAPSARVTTVLVRSKVKGGNVLTRAAFAEAFGIVDTILNITVKGNGTVGGEQRYVDICRKTGFGCFYTGALRFWDFNSVLFNTTVSNDAAVRDTVSASTYPSGGRVKRDSVFGSGYTETADKTTILTAETFLMRFYLDGAKDVEVQKQWETAVETYFIKDAKRDSRSFREYKHISVELATSRSQDGELSRNVGGDIPLLVSAFQIMIVFAMIVLGKKLSRNMLGALGCLMICLAILTGYGLAMLFGIPFTTLAAILPFILIGIGVDDAFVIVAAFDKTDRRKTSPDRIYDTFLRVGMSVTMTSMTDVTAFLLGSMSVLPAVKWFCAYAAFAIAFIYIYHCTFYCAMLALDEDRRQAGRMNWLCCLKACGSSEGGGTTTDDGAPPPPSMLSNCMGSCTKAVVSNPAAKVAVLAVFAAMAGTSVWSVASGIDTGFDIIDLTPDVSYLRDYLDQSTELYGDAGGLPATAFLAGVDLSSLKNQMAVLDMSKAALDLDYVDADTPVSSWLESFSDWARSQQMGMAFVPGFTTVLTGLQSGTGVYENQTFVVGEQPFIDAVRTFVSGPAGKRFEDSIVFDSRVPGGIRTSAIFTAYHVSMTTTTKQVAALNEMEGFTASYSSTTLPGVFVSAVPYIYFDQFRIITGELIQNFGLTLICVLVISSIVLVRPQLLFTVVVVIVLIYVDLLGSIDVWSLQLNSISTINLVMAVGLVVDYSAHIAHSFGVQDPSLSRNVRAELCMREMGPSVALGCFTTFLGIVPLAFASSEVFRVFFKMFFSIIVLGATHGLVLMPVILSIVGPAPTSKNAAKPKKSAVSDAAVVVVPTGAASGAAVVSSTVAVSVLDGKAGADREV